MTLPPEQKEDIKTIEKTRGQSISTASYTKPDLYKLISTQDFEDVARHTLTPKAWAFYSSAATDLVTHDWNSNIYRRIMLRPRVMRNVAKVETRRSILGCPSSAPFFISPAAMARLAHPDGELALARGCASEGLIQVVSNLRREACNTNNQQITKTVDIKQRIVPPRLRPRSRLHQPAVLLPTLRQRRPHQNHTTTAQSPRTRRQSHLRHRRRTRTGEARSRRTHRGRKRIVRHQRRRSFQRQERRRDGQADGAVHRQDAELG